MRVFEYDSERESAKGFVERLVNTLFPKDARHCMMHCKFATGYYDGSGAYCNNKNSFCYGGRVRSWDTVDGCACFEEGERIIPHDKDEVESDIEL